MRREMDRLTAAGASAGKAFGAPSRKQFLDTYFAGAGEVSPANAFAHVYRLLLWSDPTTGLAHCYESDKAQPGRPWYARSLRFHAWAAEQLGTSPGDLGSQIDLLFRELSGDLARGLTEQRMRKAARQRAPYEGLGMPEPGVDPELEEIIRETLQPWLREAPPAEILGQLTQRIYEHTRLENKRKNLVGEGFEDALAEILSRLPATAIESATARALIQDVPGFAAPPGGAKAIKIDLALITRPNSHRMLVSVKWSIRADREKQFAGDHQSYAVLERANRPFDYVLVTNEFDPARLVESCERQHHGHNLFDAVVHVSPDAVLATYGAERERSFRRVEQHIGSGRLTSLAAWLEKFV